MIPTKRRALLAAALTLPMVAGPRKPRAAGAGLPGLSGMQRVDGAAVPDIRFTTADGTVHTLADYAGQGVVLNLWATWCVPCVAEMPALDALARLVARDGVAVLTLSSDRGGAPPVERFYREKGIQTLPVLLDQRGDAARTLGARGIPTTLLIDRSGKERGRLEGAADWASADSVSVIRKLIGLGGEGSGGEKGGQSLGSPFRGSNA